jgi:putative two-component system response regulator
MMENDSNQVEEPKVLLVDDTAANLQVLRQTLDGCGYRLLIAKDGKTALSIVKKTLPDLVLLDIMMPDMDGYEVCQRLKSDESTRHVPVVFLTALADAEDEARGLALGAVDYITKPINPDLVRARVGNHLELKRYRDDLEKLVLEKTRELQLTQAVMIESLGTLAEYRDPETGGHIKRTQNYVKALASALKNHPQFRKELDDQTIELLYLSAPLHDIGKVGVRDNILLKPGKLDDDEFREMKKHTNYGHDALHLTEQKLGASTFLRYARQIAYTHQEKWDGTGYPQGLKGDDIPISGRLMALADVYDALISKRVYKPPMPHEEAVKIIVDGKGKHFDPDMVDAFMEIHTVFRNIALTYADHEEEREMLLEGMSCEEDSNGEIKHILLVDDNEINLEIMRNQLSALGYTMDSASNGRDALDKYETENYDLVLTDIDMPVMDGFGLAEEIRRLERAGRKAPPILAVTASEFDLNEETARTSGFDGYMLKPLDPDILKNKLKSMRCLRS